MIKLNVPQKLRDGEQGNKLLLKAGNRIEISEIYLKSQIQYDIYYIKVAGVTFAKFSVTKGDQDLFRGVDFIFRLSKRY